MSPTSWAPCRYGSRDRQADRRSLRFLRTKKSKDDRTNAILPQVFPNREYAKSTFGQTCPNLEINLEKTKIMTFNTQLQQTPRQSNHTWSFTSQYLPQDHLQKTTTLKVVDSFKYLGVPIDKDLSICTLHTLILYILYWITSRKQTGNYTAYYEISNLIVSFIVPITPP